MEGIMIWTLAEVEKLANGQFHGPGTDESRERIRKLNPAERAAFEQAKRNDYLTRDPYDDWFG
jgi:hypothetical protein